MKQAITHKEIQCLLTTMAEYLAKSVMAKRLNNDNAFLTQSNAAEYFYANYVLSVKTLLDEDPQECADVLFTWYCEYKGRIVGYENSIASNAPWNKDKDTYRGQLQAAKVFVNEVSKLLEIEDNNETTQTPP